MTRILGEERERVCRDLNVSIDGGVVQRRVIVESLSVGVGASTQQLTSHGDATVITSLVKRCPTYQTTDQTTTHH